MTQTYEDSQKICVRCESCKIFFMTTPAQLRNNNNNFCTRHCYYLFLKTKRGAYKDLTGKKFGNWTVVEDSGERKNKAIVWLCRCDCGNYGKIVGNSLVSGGSLSCGCFLVLDLTGKRFGRLLVKKRSYTKNNKIFWLCRCDCGIVKSIGGDPLRRGATVSCGCFGKELLAKHQARISRNRRTLPNEAYRDSPDRKKIERLKIAHLTDAYIKQLISTQHNISKKEIPPKAIRLKRAQITFHRLTKELKDGINRTRD